MDIWGWVWDTRYVLDESGKRELARYIYSMPHDVIAGRHEKVDEYADTAIALAREENSPWLEIFFRHWRLQSTILSRQMPKDMVKEAVSLLEYAHRGDHRDCPQSVCAVQDLAACYAAFDGPGYAQQRIDVCRENLARINARWPCYVCIGAEYAEALLDANRLDECAELIADLQKGLEEAGNRTEPDELIQKAAVLAVRQENFKKARAIVAKLNRRRSDDIFSAVAKALRAYVESVAGDFKKAAKCLPAPEKISINRQSLIFWAEAVYRIHGADPKLLPADIELKLRSIADNMEERGVYRQALQVNMWLCEMRIREGDPAAAEAFVANMERIIPALHKDEGAAEIVAAARARL